MSFYTAIAELFAFSPDYSHMAYTNDVNPNEGDILVYRLEGQEDEAELVQEIAAPDDGIGGSRSYGHPAFQPDGERLWYSIDSENESAVESIGLGGEEEPQSEGTVNADNESDLIKAPPNWKPSEDGELVDYQQEETETEIDGGTATTTYLTDGTSVDLREAEVGAMSSSTDMTYETTHHLDDQTFLAGGTGGTNSGVNEGEHGWGPLMELTLDGDGAVTDQEVIVPETESDVRGLQVSPDGSQAMLALGGEEASVAEFFHINLAEGAEPEQLGGVSDFDPDKAQATDQGPLLDVAGWLE